MELENEPIIEKCAGCSKIIPSPKDAEKQICKNYLIPKAKWRFQNCPMATHIKKEVTEEEKMDPLKRSKRSMKKR